MPDWQVEGMDNRVRRRFKSYYNIVYIDYGTWRKWKQVCRDGFKEFPESTAKAQDVF